MTQASTVENIRSTPAHGVSMREALHVWTRVALISFGGPAAQISIMHRILVDEKRWISEERFLHALNYCMLLPGPEAQQLATYIGWLMHRTLGGLIAGGFFVIPGIVSIMALSYLYAAWQHTDHLVPVRRPQSGGSRHRAGSCHSYWQARAQKRNHGWHRRLGFYRDILLQCAVSHHRPRCSADWPGRQPGRDDAISGEFSARTTWRQRQ